MIFPVSGQPGPGALHRLSRGRHFRYHVQFWMPLGAVIATIAIVQRRCFSANSGRLPPDLSGLSRSLRIHATRDVV
jgi:hypothetical protein